MNNRSILLATALLVTFFFLGGLLDILNHFISKMILFAGFVTLIVFVIIEKSKDIVDEHDDTNKKNLP